MIKNFYKFIIILLAFFVLNGATTNTKGTKIQPVGGCATTTSAKKEVKCIPEEKRSTWQKNWCQFLAANYGGKLCKLKVDCLRVKK